MEANVTFGVDFEVSMNPNPVQCNALSPNCFFISRASMNLTIDNFQQTTQLQISIGKMLSTQFSYP